MLTANNIGAMPRQRQAVASVFLTAIVSLTLTTAIPGCSHQPSLSKADAATPETATGGKTQGVTREIIATQETAAARKTESLPHETAVELGNGVKLELVLIAAGEFMMGSPDSDGIASGDEKPRHRVRITKPFYLGKYLVTYAPQPDKHQTAFAGATLRCLPQARTVTAAGRGSDSIDT